MPAKAVKISIPMSADGKRIKFNLVGKDTVVFGTGVLRIWESRQGNHCVQIEITEGLPEGQFTGTMRFTTLEINQERADLIKKSDANPEHEYELIEPGYLGPLPS